MYIKYYIFIFLFCTNVLKSQEVIKGKIVYKQERETLALEGANVYWLDTNQGTTTDELGDFNLKLSKKSIDL